MRPDWWTPELRQLTDLIAEPEVIDVRRLRDGRWLTYQHLLFGQTRITVGEGLLGYEEAW